MPFSFNLGQVNKPDISQPFDDFQSLVTGGRWSQSATDPFAGLASQGFLATGLPGETSEIGVLFNDVTAALLQPAQGLGAFAQQGPVPGSAAQLLSNPFGLKGSLQSEASPIDGRASDFFTYSGSDMRVMIEVVDPTNQGQAKQREFFEMTTLSVSVYRVKAPVRACGYINPKGFARGTRTIAGTMCLTQFTMNAMYRFLYSAGPSALDRSRDSWYKKPDQLPPYNMTLLFADEYGNHSFMRLLGVDMVNDGTVYSINDMYSEQTISYMAADFTPLLGDPGTAAWTGIEYELPGAVRTPMNVMQKESVV
jgi:hypothetical protein